MFSLFFFVFIIAFISLFSFLLYLCVFFVNRKHHCWTPAEWTPQRDTARLYEGFQKHAKQTEAEIWKGRIAQELSEGYPRISWFPWNAGPWERKVSVWLFFGGVWTEILAKSFCTLNSNARFRWTIKRHKSWRNIITGFLVWLETLGNIDSSPGYKQHPPMDLKPPWLYI